MRNMPPVVPGERQPLLPTYWPRGRGQPTCPVRIPVTTRTHYISFEAALNLRLPGEETGDWHYSVAFFTDISNPWKVALAGEGEWPDTTPSLGSKGARNMAHLLADEIIPRDCGPVWVANHYRAIADYALMDASVPGRRTRGKYCPVHTINQYLDTRDQIEHLVEEYLRPLGKQLSTEQRALHDEWLPTVMWK